MKILHLTLKRKWFDMIASGEKKEEYREIKKHWVQRICDDHRGAIGGDLMDAHTVCAYTFKEFKWVHFTNGYRPNSQIMRLPCLGIEIGTGNPEWGAESGKKYFVIKLGERVTPSMNNN